MIQTSIHTDTDTQSAASRIPRQRTVERTAPTRATEPARQDGQPAVPQRQSALRRLGRLLRRPAPSAEQVERAAAAAAWARQHPTAGHRDVLMVHQPFLGMR